ncbi:hypothetical protein BMS3Bbin16_01291 [archaeon BMS3Bbin16]|nr:hypothetical protein BMS3Bbin16_01291 [archaeon BMS3Bbin16]
MRSRLLEDPVMLNRLVFNTTVLLLKPFLLRISKTVSELFSDAMSWKLFLPELLIVNE